MAKLSEQLRLLSDRTEAIEQRAEVVQDEAVERRDATVAEARSRLEAQQKAFAEQMTAMSANTQAAWQGLGDSLRSTRNKMRSDADQGVRTLEVDVDLAAAVAEAYAYDAVEFALLVLAEADVAVMESIVARTRANELAAV